MRPHQVPALLLLLCLLLAPLAAEARPTHRTSFDPVTMTWAVLNSRIRAEFQLSPEGTFGLLSLSASGGKVWTPPPRRSSSPIFLVVDSEKLDETTPWRLVNTSEVPAPRDGMRQAITLRNDAQRLEVTLNLVVYPDQPFLRYWMVLKNDGEARRFVNDAHLMNWRFETEGHTARAFYVNQYMRGMPFNFDLNEVELPTQSSGATVFSGAHGYHCGWLALSTADGSGLVAGWEFDGRAHINARQEQRGDPLVIQGGPDNLHIAVAAGKTVTLPSAFLGVFQGDWDEAGYVTQRFVEASLAQPIPDDDFPYVMYDTWGYGTDIDEKTARRAADVAASVGVEVFILDLGWATRIGEWTEDLQKFPSGLRAFSDYVHSLGMKFGLHWVPSEADPNAPILQTNADWTSTEDDDYYGADSLCLSHNPVQNWARQTLLELVDRYQVDWLTQDGENLVKECRKTTHTHSAQNSNWSNSVNGIDALVKYARQRLPKLLWENQADGGNMLTYESVKNYVTAASCDACEDNRRRQAVYGMSYPFPTRYIDRYMTDPPNPWTLRSSMFGGPLIFMQPVSRWSAAEIDVVRREVAVYKSLRKLIRNGKVFHLAPPNDLAVHAIESFDPSTNTAVVFVYRPNSALSAPIIYPQGLRPDITYRVTFQDNRNVRVASGSELMPRGIRVFLPTRNSAEIVYISPVQ